MVISSVTFDRLSEGIQSIISTNHNSFKDEEIVLLQECLEVLEVCKNYKEPIPLELVTKIIQLITQAFMLADKFENIKDLF